MAICTGSSNYTGRNVIVEFVESCGDTDPAGLTYLPIGFSNQKDINVGTSETDNTSDDTTGVQSSIKTYLTFSVSVSGFASQSDGLAVNQALLKKYLVNEIIAGRQPTVFIRVIMPDVTYYAFCNVSTTSNSAASTDAVTYSFEFTATATPAGSGIKAVEVVDTP